MNVIKQLLKDPLTHFLLIGVALFALAAYLPAGNDSRQRHVITISEADIKDITDSFKASHGRSPAAAELDEQLAIRVREKILTREAMALGLMENDPVTRRHLSSKMRFLAEGLVDAEALSDQALADYLGAHEKDYLTPATISYEQIYFDPAIRGGAAQDDASEALSAILKGQTLAAKVAGDISEKVPRKSYTTTESVKKTFGQKFADSLMTLTENKWHGPIESDLGLHLVYVSQRKGGGIATLDRVRDQVRQALAFERYYESISDEYEVRMPSSRQPGSADE